MIKSLFGLVILLSVTMAGKAQKVSFEVSFKEPQAHYAEVEMNVDGFITKPYVDVKMPVWTPGSYLVREFAKNVESFSATAAGKSTKWEKVNKNTWRIYHNKAAQVKINYRVYAFEISVRTAFVDDSHAFLSPASIFMYPAGMIKMPSTVKIVPFGKWNKVSTGLEPVAGKNFTYSASDFDILFDSPIEVGNQDVFEFMAAGVRHEVAMYGGGNYDRERVKADLAKIVEASTAVYGENPNKHYTFIIHNHYASGGGLEHLNSCVMGATRNAYTDPAGYKRFLGLAAHEYSHLWNVKRLRPIALGPFDYDNENYTSNLWIAEGFTSYYESKFLFRGGFSDQAGLIAAAMGNIGTTMNTPGAKINSAAASSFDAWINPAYRPSENSKNTFISYYTKGAVVGVLMDLAIAQATNGTKSLDDVMKAMYLQCKTLKRGYTDAEFKLMVEKISGTSFTDFWAKYVTGTADIEVEKYFAYAGIKATVEPAYPNKPFTGTTLAIGDALTIATVLRNSTAWEEGLNVNDEILMVEGLSVRAALQDVKLPNPALSLDVLPVVANKKVGEKITLKVRRDGIEREITLTLKDNPNVRLKTEIDPNASAQQVAVRNRWMHGK